MMDKSKTKKREPIVPKQRKFSTIYKKLLSYFKGTAGILVLGIILSVTGVILSVFTPSLLGNITTEIADSVIEGRLMSKSLILGIAKILIAMYLIDAVSSYVSALCMTTSLQTSMYNLRKDIQSKLEKLPLRYFDNKPFGDVLSTVTNDVDTVANTMQQTLTQMINIAVQLVGVLIMMFTISPKLSLIALATIPLSFLVARFIIVHVQKYFVIQQQAIADVNSYTEEMYSGYSVTKLFGQEKHAIEGFDKVNDKLAEIGFKSGFYSYMTGPLIRVISNLGVVAVSVLGALMVLSKQFKIGDIQAFISYTRKFTMPLNQLGGMASTIQQGAAAGNRIIDFLEAGEEEDQIARFEGEFEFANVYFGYNANEPIIKNFNLKVKPGQTIAIVGPTGAGKTTLINLIMRFYGIDSGDIKIDGQSIYTLDMKTLRLNIGMVLQNAWLFEGTIADNIKYGNRGASQDDVEKAAKIAFADGFIKTLPEGYNTVIKEDGASLSQGQRQLLTIARAVVADPAILILDEATSSVDTRTEVLLQKAMDRVMEGRTSFVIAHRLSTIRNADKILVLNKGSVVEQGTHEELLEQGGFYSVLYNSQFADVEIEEDIEMS